MILIEIFLKYTQRSFKVFFRSVSIALISQNSSQITYSHCHVGMVGTVDRLVDFKSSLEAFLGTGQVAQSS